jgi:hypothetical protein
MPVPRMDAITDKTVCNGAQVKIKFTTPITGVLPFTGVPSLIYNWQGDQTNWPGMTNQSTIGKDSITIASINNDGVNEKSTEVTFWPTIQKYSNSYCSQDESDSESKKRAFKIHVRPTPEMFPTLSKTICSNSTVTENSFYSDNGSVVSFHWEATGDWDKIHPNPAPTGEGDMPSFKANPNTTDAQFVATITVQPKIQECFDQSKAESYTITVMPVPKVNDIKDEIVCRGSNVNVDFNTTITIPTVRYVWDASASADAKESLKFNYDETKLKDTTNKQLNILARDPKVNISYLSTIEVTPVIEIPERNNTITVCNGSPKSFTVTVPPNMQYSDIRLRACPGVKNINLAKYVDTTHVKAEFEWSGDVIVSPVGLVFKDTPPPTGLFTFKYLVRDECMDKSLPRKFYLSVLDKDEKPAVLNDTIVVYYLHAEAVNINQIFGIETGDGTWTYHAFENGVFNYDIKNYVVKSTSLTHNGAVVMNGRKIYESLSSPGTNYKYRGKDSKAVKFSYASPLLDGGEQSSVIILTK